MSRWVAPIMPIVACDSLMGYRGQGEALVRHLLGRREQICHHDRAVLVLSPSVEIRLGRKI